MNKQLRNAEDEKIPPHVQSERELGSSQEYLKNESGEGRASEFEKAKTLVTLGSEEMGFQLLSFIPVLSLLPKQAAPCSSGSWTRGHSATPRRDTDCGFATPRAPEQLKSPMARLEAPSR